MPDGIEVSNKRSANHRVGIWRSGQLHRCTFGGGGEITTRRSSGVSGSWKTIFLSYASEDTDAARRICDALRTAGFEVWSDQSELRGGEAWDASICPALVSPSSYPAWQSGPYYRVPVRHHP